MSFVKGRHVMVDQPKIVFDESEVLRLIQMKRKNVSWIREQMPELRKKYRCEFIAVDDRKIIDSDKSFDALLRRLRRRAGDLSAITFEFVPEREYIHVL